MFQTVTLSERTTLWQLGLLDAYQCPLLKLKGFTVESKPGRERPSRVVVRHSKLTSIMKDISSLSLEKYVDELPGATMEGVARCRTEKDVWSAVEVRVET